jgi:septal ring factor EnvC (AmiA/AmiB activator)
MKITKQDIVFGIIVILLLWNIFSVNSVKTDVKGYKDKIEHYQKSIDSAKIVDNQISTKIDSVNNKVTNITNEITQIDKKVTIIRNQTNEKVNNIDKLSNAELEQFFTNRYNQYNTPK